MKKSSGGMNMHSGMTRKAPAGVDKSMSIPKGSTVNSDPTRGGVAATPKTLGPRDA